MVFQNRKEAGEKLARALSGYKNAKDVVVLALPRGGVVVGFEVAKGLKAPLDIVVPRKIGALGNEEYAIGAITETGEGIFNEPEIKHVDPSWLSREIEKERKEARRRLRLYRGGRPLLNLKNKTIIIVDDGVATGYTMRAAIKSVRTQNPKKIVVAVPHGAKDSLDELRGEADEVIALEEPEWYGAVGSFYREFSQTTDEEVIALLRPELRIRNQELRIKKQGPDEVATEPKKSIKFSVFIILAFCFMILGGIFANEIFLPHTVFSGQKSVEIPRGLGSREIAGVLKNEGIIRSKWAFVIYVSLKSMASDLKPGSYVFFNQASIPTIALDLTRGGTNEVILVIPEGWAADHIAERMDEKGIASGREFLAVVADRQLEGMLFPDTYRVFRDSSAKDIVEILNENFEKKLTPEFRQEIERQEKSISEIVIMASLIEKEVVSDEDRAIVSGILWKRLKAGIPLQVDATISYIKAQSTEYRAQNGKITIADTKIDSPYNTYKYRGLPIGPIGNPGLSAIRAAIYPKASPFFYYLSAPDGKTVFSRTLEEHNEAKSKYLR